MRILIVDDDEAIRLLLTSRLRAIGYELETASNGREAWRMISTRPPDLVICDWNMPEMDGLELCRKIREADWINYVYVILCTAMSQKSDYLMAMEAGADDFAVKPIEFADIHVRVRAAERIINLQAELTAQNRSLRELYVKLSTAYGTIERDLQAAATLQLELLPRQRDLIGAVRLDWLLIPSQFLAGDMLNYFLVGRRELVFYHLDVAGHGIPAALLSVMLNRLLVPVAGSPIVRSGIGENTITLLPPADVIAGLNSRFQGQGDSYFTMIYGILNIETGEVTFCQAGHPGPLVVSPSGTVTELGEGGFPVGLMPDMDYDEQRTQLARGERLVLRSDGITECQNEAGQRYGEAQLSSFLSKQADGSLSELVESVRNELSSWRGTNELSDDLSLLVMERYSE